MAYEIELHYGFERSHDTYETYHAFEATDIEEEADDAAIEAKLADLLDCSPDDEDFDCKSMRITLPERTVERIRAEGYAAGRLGVRSTTATATGCHSRRLTAAFCTSLTPLASNT